MVTEEPRLYLVWIHDRIFIKPLLRYLLSHMFWEMFFSNESDQLGERKNDLRGAAIRFLRTYLYLIQRESDLTIAQYDGLRLIPKDVQWSGLCHFVSGLRSIEDSEVSGRYHYGELRLSRLNLYAPFLLRKFHFEQVHGQYGDYFAQFYGPMLFVFAVIYTMLNSMQVVLAAEQGSSVHQVSMRIIYR